MRSWLYQPFLYYFIHDGSSLLPPSPLDYGADADAIDPMSRGAVFHGKENLTPEDAAALYHFVMKGIECNLKILDVRSLRHRHHGLWYDMRSVMCASLILLAIVKSNKDAWIPGSVSVLWGAEKTGVIGGKIGHVLQEYEFWSTESPDLKRHRDVLVDLTREVQGIWASRQ